jgi:DNA-binding MarR family transcriptional regulator
VSGAPSDDEVITTWGLVMEASAGVNARLEREMQQELGIPLTFFEVLLRLGRSEGDGVSLNALAAQVSFSSGGFSRLVDRMEARGLVERRACPTNRRSTLVALTTKGRGVLDDALRVHADGLRRHLVSALGPGEVVELANTMRTVRDALDGPR